MATQIVEPLALRPRAAATAIGISPRTLWGLTAPRGPIPCVRIGPPDGPANNAARRCDVCQVALIETPTCDGFLNFDCPKCDRCFGCRPSSKEVAARFDTRGKRADSI